MNHLLLWRWQGLTLNGKQSTGYLWATDKSDAVLQLQQQEVCALSLRRIAVRKRYWRGRYRIHFIRQLASLLQAGISLTSALTLLAQQQPQPQWQALIAQLARRLHEGMAFSQAVSQWREVFPPLFVALLQTGEASGKLDECCQKLAQQQEQQLKLQQKTGKALRYPLFILLLAVLISIAMLNFVLPEFAAIYQSFNAPLPVITRALLAISAFTSQHALLLSSGTALIIASVMLLRHKRFFRLALAKTLLAIPLINTMLQSQRLSLIYTILALCQQSGLPLLQGLDNAISSQPCPLWQPAMRRIRQHTSEGNPLWQGVAAEKLFSSLCSQLIRSGEISGTLDIMLNRLADWHSEQAFQRAEQLAAALEPAMMIIIGGIIGGLVIAMYLPIFQLGDIIGAG